MIVVRFQTLATVTGSVYVGFEGYNKGWFSADSVDFGQGNQFKSRKGDESGSALDLFVEKAEKNELSISKHVDAFTPLLMFKAATDRKLKGKQGESIDISFLAVRSGTNDNEVGVRSWLKLSFGTCFLTDWKLSGSGDEATMPTESLTISYNQVAIGIAPHHKAAGGANAPIVKSVDLIKLGAQQSETGIAWSDGELRVK